MHIQNTRTTTRGVGVIVLALIIGAVEQTSALIPPNSPPPPDLDKRVGASLAVQLTAQREQAAIELQTRIPSLRVDYNPVTGAPVWVTCAGFLSRTREEEIQRIGSLGLAYDDPHRAIKAFIIENAELFGYGPEALTNATITREFVAAHNGMRTVVWQQQFDGIPVFEGVLIGHITQSGRLVNISSHFLPDIETAGGSDRPAKFIPAVSAVQALANAQTELGLTITADDISVVGAAPTTPEKRQTLSGATLFGDAKAKLVWLPMNRSSLRLCWSIEFVRRPSMEGFRSVVDATSGEVLVRQNRTFREVASYRVYSSDSPSPFTPGWTTPSTTQPASVNRTLVTVDALSPTASPQGWVEAGSNPRTIGNNVDATAWRGWGSLAVEPSPRPHGPQRVFDFCSDLLNQEPDTYMAAAVVNLFYWCNWTHDKLYDLGFTEAAGNFQQDNFGRGGSAGDPILAFAQAGADAYWANDAQYLPASDGTSGQIYIFIWNGPSPNRDGGLDAEVILHEYTHGLSDRLVGGGAGIGMTAVQTKGLAEGWSDFYALSLLSQPTDNVNGTYPIAGYVTYHRGSLPTENYYYGIRRYPYTHDMTKNPLTFKDIDPAQSDPHVGVPLNPFHGPPSCFPPGSRNCPSEVHFQGQVWCVTLWEARRNLIGKYGQPVGNQLMLQLATDGMKLCPPNPNFIQARDAILQADLVNNCAANWGELRNAFHKRGMGRFASSPDSSTTSGVVESFAEWQAGSPCDE